MERSEASEPVVGLCALRPLPFAGREDDDAWLHVGQPEPPSTGANRSFGSGRRELQVSSCLGGHANDSLQLHCARGGKAAPFPDPLCSGLAAAVGFTQEPVRAHAYTPMHTAQRQSLQCDVATEVAARVAGAYPPEPHQRHVHAVASQRLNHGALQGVRAAQRWGVVSAGDR